MRLGRLLRIGIAGFGAVIALAASGAAARPAALPSVTQMVGQLLLVRMEGRDPSTDFLARVRRGEIGGVVLYGDNYGPAGPTLLSRKLQGAAAEGGQPKLLIAIDQEGGSVKRLAGPPTIAPSEMTTAAVAQAQGRETARNLRGYGIDVDFAPVLDVGRRRLRIAPRSFDDTPAGVATRSGVDTPACSAAQHPASKPAKHFPGLYGYARANTDKGRAARCRPVQRDPAQGDLPVFAGRSRPGLPMVIIFDRRLPEVRHPRPCRVLAHRGDAGAPRATRLPRRRRHRHALLARGDRVQANASGRGGSDRGRRRHRAARRLDEDGRRRVGSHV